MNQSVPVAAETKPIRVVIIGAAGRMGKMLIKACDEHSDFQIVGATERSGSAFLGIDCGALGGVGDNGIRITDAIETTLDNAQAVIDFSLPDSTVDNVAACADAGCAMVIGTTGLTAAQHAKMRAAAQHIPIIYAPNMSVGINLCFDLIAMAAAVLGDDTDVEIMETHHRDKVDAPSGTAIKMGEIVAKSLDRDLHQCAVYGRQGRTGVRERKTIGFQTTRGGDIVGEHTVLFASVGERIEITHRSSSRMNFARGALRATAWVIAHPPGLYAMQDVLGLS